MQEELTILSQILFEQHTENYEIFQLNYSLNICVNPDSFDLIA
jgi:hypothetical protein